MRNVLSEYRIKKIIKYFCEDIDATKTSKILEINRNTINRYFNIFRLAILCANKPKNIKISGEFELDESYFGAKRVRGKKGRGAAGKTPVFGLLKRDGKVFVEVVKNCSKQQLMPIIQGNILEGSTIHTDGWKAYDGLVLNGYTHHRVFHSHDEFVRGKSHVNGIESFWSLAKRRLSKFNGLTDDKFYLHLKECEFRFNNRQNNINLLINITNLSSQISLDPIILIGNEELSIGSVMSPNEIDIPSGLYGAEKYGVVSLPKFY